MSDFSKIEVSAFRNAKAKTGMVMALQSVVSWIRSGGHELAERTERCRALVETDEKEYKQFKESSMPAVTFAGTFRTRDKEVPFSEKMLSHSGFVVLDFDSVDIGSVLAEVSQMPSTFLAFVSPSGAGVKVVIAVSPVPSVNIDEHKSAWGAAVEAYEHIAVADPSGSDPTRLCLLAHYPQVFFETENRQPVEWELDDSEFVPVATRYTGDADVSALDFISADDYDTWLKTGMACHAAGVPFEVWHEWSQKSEKHEPCT